jgi:TnpA family transposase
MHAALPFQPTVPTSFRHSRAGFERIPSNLSRAELLRYFTFGEEDRCEISQCRGEHNQIGFALLLGGVRLTGRFLYDFSLVPRSLLAHICEQLGLEVPLFVVYPQRQPTRYEHVERLKAYLGLRTFTPDDPQLIAAHIRQQVRAGARLHELLPSAEQMLRAHGIVLPGVTVLQKLIGTARMAAEDELFVALSGRVDEATKERILALLQVPPGQRLTPFQRLHQAAGRPSPEAFAQEVELLTQVRELLPADLDLSDLAPPLLERLAGLVSGLPTHALLPFHAPKRLGLLLCWLWRLHTQLIDTALTISNELVAGVLRRAKHAAAHEHQRQQKRLHAVLTLCSDVVSMVLDQAIADPEVRTAVFQRWTREQLAGLPAEGRALAAPAEQLYIAEVRRRYSYVRQFAPRLLETFVLHALVPHEPLLQAVDYLRERNRVGHRGLDADAPIEFIPPAWKPYVCPTPGEIDRPLWELCLLDQLRQALKGGNLHVPPSQAFQPLDTYLLRREQWERERIQLSQAQPLPLDFAPHWPTLEALLTEQLRLLAESYPTNPHLEIRDDQFHLARPDRLPVPPSAQELRLRVRPLLQRRHLSDLLLETQRWTGFLSAFTRLASGRPVTAADTAGQVALLAGLIAEGCNIGLRDMAVVGPGLSFDQLEEVYATYIREETLAQATATLVNFQLQQPLAEAWGQGTTSSSDARVYGVPVRALNATFHPKYFASAGRGINVYTHVSDLWIPFYPQVITCHVRQAPYILDGLLYHATHLEPREHYTDTHGYTEMIFAVCHRLGLRFAPRIKDLPEQRLWRLPGPEPYRHIESVLAGKLNVQLIRESGDERLRLVASIKSGEVRASLIVGKLAAASHRNKLFRGLQELGRLVKTAYLAEYLRSEELRRRVLLGLNKGEALNAVARKLFFGGQGEIRDRTYEDQLNAASALNLLLAALVVWNTVHLQACLRRLRAEGQPMDDTDLRFLSPLMQRHIGIYGQYRFDVQQYGAAAAPDTLTY